MPDLDPTHLRELYKMALEEDRYQIQLNWDKTKFFMLLDASLIAAGAALVRIHDFPLAAALGALTFFAGALIALVGYVSLGEGKVYHRHAVAKCVLIGDKLGMTEPFSELPAQTLHLVSGMTLSKAREVLAAPDRYVTPKLRKSGVSGWVRVAFVVLSLTNLVGLGISIYIASGCRLGGC
jgi:hypothetical protein